jgi:serine/threonine protein kinase
LKVNLADLSSEELLRRWKAGEGAAADLIVERYSLRLVALVASRMNRRWQGAAGPEDVVQSALGSFFDAIKQSRLRASQILSVWHLLATIAKRKMLRTIERESASKRGGESIPISLETILGNLVVEPTDATTTELLDQLMTIDDQPSPHLGSILERMIAGQTQQEIAKDLDVSERTVRRVIAKLKTAAGQIESFDPHEKLMGYEPLSLPRWKYGDFVLGKMIGQGAFGKVYRAVVQPTSLFQEKINEVIAVKFLRKQFWKQGEAKQLLFREIDQAAKVDHPNVVSHLGWGESPHGGPFIIQQFIDGRQLTHSRQVSAGQFSQWLLQICDALDAIHGTGTVHGDLTPNNILIGENGRVHLTDFGFARSISVPGSFADVRLQDATYGGTLGFAAPEQIASAFGTLGPHTDLFALGAIAYWYLTGHAPFLSSFVGVSHEQTMHLQSLELNSRRSKLLNFALRCLQKSPADRPRTTRQIRYFLSDE